MPCGHDWCVAGAVQAWSEEGCVALPPPLEGSDGLAHCRCSHLADFVVWLYAAQGRTHLAGCGHAPPPMAAPADALPVLSLPAADVRLLRSERLYVYDPPSSLLIKILIVSGASDAWLG